MNRNRNSKRKIIIGLLIAALLIGLFFLVLRFLENSGIIDEQFGDSGGWGDDEDEIYLMFDEDEYISADNIDTSLIMGTDAGGEFVDEAHKGTLADFLALIIIDNTTKKFGIIQIDRNTMMPMTELTGSEDKQQLCLAHWYGENEGQRNDNTVMTVSELFGYLDIDNYYVINMKDIGKVNDAIGGVEVSIDTDMTDLDPAFVEGSSVQLKGDQARLFLSTRMQVGGGTNKERMSRQSQYMSKVYDKVIGQLHENPDYLNDLYDSLSDVIQREENGSNLSRMANHVLQYENVGILQIDGEVRIADTIGEGIEHEEFYADNASIVEVLGKIMNLSPANE